ncbi:hypothetical protein EMCRGX_G012270 [Ephydatia muelleri]
MHGALELSSLNLSQSACTAIVAAIAIVEAIVAIASLLVFLVLLWLLCYWCETRRGTNSEATRTYPYTTTRRQIGYDNTLVRHGSVESVISTTRVYDPVIVAVENPNLGASETESLVDNVQINNIPASTESTDATVNAGHGNILLNPSEESVPETFPDDACCDLKDDISLHSELVENIDEQVSIYRRYAKELLSPVVFTMRRPKSVKNDMERGPQTPVVSKATGVKEWEVIGRVCNQEPDSFLEADKSLALDKGSGAVAKSSAAMEETLGRSHDFCRYYVYHQHISPRVTWSSNRPFFSKKYQSALALLSTLEEIGSIDSHVALALLRLCSGFSKLIHIARVTPPHLILNAMQRYDVNIHRSFANCTGVDTSDAAWKQAKITSSTEQDYCTSHPMRGGDVTLRHNAMRDVLFNTFDRASLSAHLEVGSGWGRDCSRTHPADILVTNWAVILKATEMPFYISAQF